ncbi:hypothetical protein [Pendulispora albinea]|uniref:Fibronectin type-III domain-containing protein n=1 Tax=Pendulispora albinea TaxID=2741071 RepID=A0ABZ2M4F6_9BACT
MTLAVWAAMIALLSYERRADAELSIDIRTITRVAADGSGAPAHPAGVPDTTLTKQDCEDDVRLRFALSLSGIDNGHQLQMWAGGGSCSPTASRTGNAAICGQVAAPLDATLQVATEVEIRVRDLAQQRFADTKNLAYTAATKSACSLQPTSGAQNVTIYFLWLANPSAEPEGSQTSQVTLSTRGPDSPATVTAGEGDRVLVIGWKAPTGASTSIVGYKVFCDPVDQLARRDVSSAHDVDTAGEYADGSGADDEASGNAVDGGDGGDGGKNGNDAGVCPYTPSTERQYVPGAASTKGTVRNLVNGVEYACAVAATDKTSTMGKLSSSVCATPGPVGDFFYRYREAGGVAGGCAIEGAPLTEGVVMGAMSVFGLAMMQRRRRMRRSASGAPGGREGGRRS